MVAICNVANSAHPAHVYGDCHNLKHKCNDNDDLGDYHKRYCSSQHFQEMPHPMPKNVVANERVIYL